MFGFLDSRQQPCAFKYTCPIDMIPIRRSCCYEGSAGMFLSFQGFPSERAQIQLQSVSLVMAGYTPQLHMQERPTNLTRCHRSCTIQ